MARFTQLFHEQYQAFRPCLEQLHFVAAKVGEVPLASLRHELDAVCAFLLSQLEPHTRIAGQVLYPLVEYILAAPGATAAMRVDHVEIRRLIDELLVLRATLNDEPFQSDQVKALQRMLQELTTLVTVHLAQEETVYLPLLAAKLTAAADHGVLVVIEMVAAELKYDP